MAKLCKVCWSEMQDNETACKICGANSEPADSTAQQAAPAIQTEPIAQTDPAAQTDSAAPMPPVPPVPPTAPYNATPVPPASPYNAAPMPPASPYNAAPMPPTAPYNAAPQPPVYPYAPPVVNQPADPPVSVGAFLGLNILFNLPLVGFIAILIVAFAPENKTIKNFARSYLVWYLILVSLSIFIGLILAGSIIDLVEDFPYIVEEVIEEFI